MNMNEELTKEYLFGLADRVYTWSDVIFWYNLLEPYLLIIVAGFVVKSCIRLYKKK